MVRALAWPQLTLRIHYAQATSSTDNGESAVALKPMGRESTEVRNREYQWFHKMMTCHYKQIKKQNNTKLKYLLLIVDIDECETMVCGPNTNCTNYGGGYTCNCEDGYVEREERDAYGSKGCSKSSRPGRLLSSFQLLCFVRLVSTGIRKLFF